MSAKQLMLPANRAFNNGLAISGAQAKLYVSGTSTPASFYADNGLTVSLGSTLTANGAGRFATAAYQDEATPFRLKILDKQGEVLDDIDPYYFGLVPGVDGAPGDTGPTGPTGPAGDVASATSRSALKLFAASDGSTRYLKESGREGIFVFSSANLATQVAADTQEAIYIVPVALADDGSQGAWVRKFTGSVNAKWFGIVDGNASGANGTANFTAWSAMLATLRARSPAALTISTFQSIEPIYFPLGYYEFASTLDLTDATGKLLGDTTGGANWYGTVFKFPSGVTGIRTQRTNSTGATGTRTAARGGDDWIIDGIGVIGGFSGTEAEAHGFHLRSRAVIRNFWISDFEGDGIYSNTNTTDGIADYSHIEDGRIIRCRNGIFFDGADTNICTVIGVSCASNRQWGVWDSSFLGNSYFGCHTDSNAKVSANNGTTIPVSLVSSGGNWYFCIQGQETGASTNAPSGTTADNTWWGYLSSGAPAPSIGIPAWVSGITVRAGGAYCADSANARNLFSGCYYEGSQGLPQIATPSMIMGGSMTIWRGSSGIFVQNNLGNVLANGGLGSRGYYGTDETFTASLGERGSGAKVILSATGTTTFPSVARLVVSGNEIEWNYANSATNRAYLISGPNTTLAFGGSAAQPHSFVSSRLRVGIDTGGSARLLSAAGAAPSTGQYAKGDFTLNNVATTAGPFAWQCTTAGTTGGTQTPLYSGYGVGNIGYSTGAGGAITQATSRTTGVTLNKLCGQITLVSAAGTATWQSMTVTNSQVAVNDVIRLNQQSGTDKYMLHVTNVAAGSFEITYATTGGTTTEQPKFNFAIIKAVAA